jgi:PIN domain nuclease of toxin-antitoxin system
MKYLIDSSALIFTLQDSPLLTKKARELMESNSVRRVFSVAVFWDMTIKIKLGKLPLRETPTQLWRDLEANQPGCVLSITQGHLDRLATLPYHHLDPFDRLMIAQALEEGWSVVSSDEQWDAYGVTRIW